MRIQILMNIRPRVRRFFLIVVNIHPCNLEIIHTRCMSKVNISEDHHYLPLQFLKALPSLLTCGMLRPQNKQLGQLQQALRRLHSLADWP